MAWVLLAVGLLLVAAFLRMYKLESLPAGLHQDEAWFAYNGLLLSQTGKNIYGEFLPLTVDMWGEQVTATHSYVIAALIPIFGVNYFTFRLAIVIFGLIMMILAGVFLYWLTKNKLITSIFLLLMATSQWSIIMNRASSTIAIDVVMMLITLMVFYQVLKLMKQNEKKDQSKIAVGLIASYALMGICYLTYFSSRILIPPMMVLTAIYSFYGAKMSYKKWLLALLPVVIYLGFPFLTFFQTPYARGRYEETKIIGSELIEVQQFQAFNLAGQAHLPVLMTRALFNKPILNLQAVVRQYVAFFSPDVLLFQTAPPIRYYVPNSGVINLAEYVGFILAIGVVFLGWKKGDKKQQQLWWTTGYFLGLLAIAAVPTALTIDDFPNLQRGVLMVPFWQVVAALGWGVFGLKWLELFKSKKKQEWFIVGLALLISLNFGPFLINYFALMRYDQPYHRSRAGEELGKWLAQQDESQKILIDSNAAIFLYPYLYKKENILEKNIIKEGKYFLTAKQFQIDNWLFVNDLTKNPDYQEEILAFAPKFLVLNAWKEQADEEMFWQPPEGFKMIKEVKYDDGQTGFRIYENQAQ